MLLENKIQCNKCKASLETQWHIKGTFTEEVMIKELAYRGEEYDVLP